MPSADELILQMQHLTAQAKATLEANAARAGIERLKSAAQRLAWETQKQIAEHEKTVESGEAKLDELKVGGVTPEEAGEFVAVRNAVEAAKKALVKARAQLNFALDRMELAERQEYLAFHAEVRAETHGHLANDLGPKEP